MTASERTAWLDLENYATRTVKVNRTELDQILHKHNSKTADRLGFMQVVAITSVIALLKIGLKVLQLVPQ